MIDDALTLSIDARERDPEGSLQAALILQRLREALDRAMTEVSETDSTVQDRKVTSVCMVFGRKAKEKHRRG